MPASAFIHIPNLPAMQPLTFRLATGQDADRLASLVNSAYRGASSRLGWTTEADLLGGQRTDREEILELINTAGSVMLLGIQHNNIVTTLHLQRDGHNAHLGMFAIQPGLQGAGLGKQCLLHAEHYAQQQWHASTMQMAVITRRHELIAYYERRGYCRTGVLRPFPASPRCGLPKVDDLQLEMLEKAFNRSA